MEEQRTILSRIRDNMGLVVVVIAFSLAVFILTDFITGNKRANTGNKGSMGTVLGEDMDKAKYDELYQQRSDMYQKQGVSMSDAERIQLQDGIWNQMISEKVFGAQYKSLGLTVSPEEVKELFTGKNVSSAVKQYFDAYFKQNNKPFNTEDVQKYLNQAITNEEEKVNLKQFEDYLINTRLREKFDAMVSSVYLSSKAQAERKNKDQNRKFNISFVGVPFSQIVDSTIKVEDSELMAFMSKSPEKYKQEEQTILKFTKFDLKPTLEDSLKAKNDVMKYREKFAAATNDSAFVYSRTRNKFDPKKYVPLKDLPAGAKDSVKLVAPKTVFGPIKDGDAYKLYKLIDRKQGGTVNANVRQIVIRAKSPSAADSAAALSEASAIKAIVNAQNFGQIASEKSQDQSKMSGGSIGWVSTPSQYGAAFDEAVKSAPKGAIVGPIKGNQGYHILLIEDKTDETFLVAEVEKIISVSATTATNVSKAINDFAQKAIATKDIEAAGKTSNVPTQTSTPLKKNEKFVAGMPARELVLWSITAKEGDFSKVFNMGDSYVFAQVFKKQKEGLQDLSDEAVKNMVKKEVLAEKKAKIILEKLNTLQGKSMEEIKTGYGAGAFAATANDVSFESQQAGALGADPYLIGKICGMAKGATSKPIVGKTGVFIIQVTDIKEATPLDAKAIETSKKGAASAGQSLIKGRIEQALIKSADVKDNRWELGI